MALTTVSDIVVPEVFTPHSQRVTEEKSKLLGSGALARDGQLDEFLAGGGATIKRRAFDDIPNDPERVATEASADETSAGSQDPALTTAHGLITSQQDIVPRISRNASWSASVLARVLSGPGVDDPMTAITGRTGTYWALRLQKAVIAMVRGVVIENATNDSNDYGVDIAGAGFVDGVTNFSAEAQIDAAQTMGDSSEDLSLTLVHSVVFARMKKNNLIDTIPDATGRVQIPTYLGSLVVVDDGMPSAAAATRASAAAGSAGIFESWFFGPGALGWGVGTPPNATAVETRQAAGNGASEEVLWNRVMWALAFGGHSFIMGSIPDGGPSNTNLAAVANWNRTAQERKMIKFARLVTRES